MTPSWYDLLDVEPDATTDEVRAAWKARIADLDPTDRRFAVLNRAAKVLLDPDARAAHDAELAAQDKDPDDEAEVGGDDEGESTAPAVAPVVLDKKKTPATKPAAKKPVAKKAAGKPLTSKPVEKTGDRPQAGSLVLAVLAAVMALSFLVIAACAYVFSTDSSELDDARSDARAAAEQAIVPILSYDATDLEAGRSSALGYLTDDFAEDYEALFDGIVQQNAPELGTRSEAVFLASGIVRGNADRVQVLVFVDQSVTNSASAQPRIFSNQVTMTMERVGDRWLVDDLETSTDS